MTALRPTCARPVAIDSQPAAGRAGAAPASFNRQPVPATQLGRNWTVISAGWQACRAGRTPLLLTGDRL